MDPNEPENSLQRVIQPLLLADRALQMAEKIKYDLVELEEMMEDLPLTLMTHNLENTRKILDAIIFALELEKLQTLLRLRHELHVHRQAFGRMPAVGLR